MLSIASLGGLPQEAHASGDDSCFAAWTLASPNNFSRCGGRAAISPGNDTRVNLLLLMRSLKPLNEKGASLPNPGMDGWGENWQLGHTFFSWEGLRAALWPQSDAGDIGAQTGPVSAITTYTPQNNTPTTPPANTFTTFTEALAAETQLPISDRVSLVTLRAQVGYGTVDWGAPVSSERGREYLAYLKAAAAFYAGDWVTAQQKFTALTHAHSSWVTETSSYMLIRIWLGKAVAIAINQYGDFELDKVDTDAAAKAMAAITTYLETWPHGRYATSARGLIRRVLWLEGKTTELARTYEQLMHSTPADSEQAADLAEEIDDKLLASNDSAKVIARAGDTPLLLAVVDLRLMRSNGVHQLLALSAKELATQQSQFVGMDKLYTFLQATRAYYAGDAPDSILPLVPDAARAHSYTPLAFSRQVLRGMALARAHDRNEVGFWRDLITGSSPLYQRPLAELGLALRWQHDRRVGRIFAADSPIEDSTILGIVLQTIATPAILRTEAANANRPVDERDVALFTLLYKDLSHGAYRDFGRDVTLVPADAGVKDEESWRWYWPETVSVGVFTRGKWSDNFDCPPLATTAATLSRNPNNRRAQLCLGEFWRLNYFDGFTLSGTSGAADELGSGPAPFPGPETTRDALYAEVIADRYAKPDVRAYALYRAVRCYAPSGNNSCSNRSVSVKQRRTWFKQLKKSYPNSRWAKDLQGYW